MMRGQFLATLLLTLSGCAFDNPGFQLVTDPASDSEATGASTTPPTSTVDPTTAPTDPTTTTTPVDSSSSGDTPPDCPRFNDAFAPYLLTDGQRLPCPAADFAIMGKLSVGDPLQLLPEPNCGSIDPFVYTLGTGIALSPQANGGCVKVFLNASDQADGCKINWIKGYTEMTMPPIYKLLAAFSAAAPAEFPITPQAQNSNYCGCPDPGNDGESCCTGLDPGELTLQPVADTKLMIEQFSNAQIAANNQSFTFYNIQSWVGPECVDNTEGGHHIDWIAVAND